MLLDRKLILVDDTLDNIASGNSDVIDISNLGMESGALSVFVLFLAEANAGTLLSWVLKTATDIGLTAGVVNIALSGSLSPSTTAIPAGTLFNHAIPFDLLLGTPKMKTYLGLDFTQAGSPAADEPIIAWVGRMQDIPNDVGGLS